MNASIFWRLVWKEYRAQRPLWIAILALAVMLELCLLVSMPASEGRVNTLFGYSLVLTAIYALGCAAVLFAAEHETQTYASLQALPVKAGQVLAAKAAFAVVSTATLMATLWGLAAAFSGWRIPAPETHKELWGVCGFGAAEGLVWGALFSLLLRGPLRAAILGVSAASLAVHLCVQGGTQSYAGAAAYVAALPQRAAVVAAVALADLWLGLRWFRVGWHALEGRGLAVQHALSGRATLPQTPESGTGCLTYRTIFFTRGIPASPSWGSMLTRLAWQHWRQSGWALAALGLLAALGAVPTAMARPHMMLEYAHFFEFDTPGPGQLMWPNPRFYGSLWLWAVIAPALLGVFAFRADQRGASFRFLADRGVSPRLVWLSRQLSWLCLVVLGAAALLLAASLLLYETPRVVRGGDPWLTWDVFTLGISHAGRILLMVILGCATGQLCAMLLPSGLLAGMLALVLSVLAVVWASMMSLFEMSWFWSVAPIPLAMLLATWLRAPDWLAERRRLRTWLLPGLVLVVPAVGLFVAMALVRAYEVPAEDPGFSIEEYSQPASPEARKTAQMYLRAVELGSWHPERDAPPDRPVRTQTERDRESLEMALEATRRPTCDFLAQSELLVLPEKTLASLGQLVESSASRLEVEGKLDEALDRWFAVLRLTAHLRQRSGLFWQTDWLEQRVYEAMLGWAARPGQSSERIVGAIRRLEQFHAGRPAPSESVKWLYWRSWRTLLDDSNDAREVPTPLWLRYCPWERERTRRVLNRYTSRMLGGCDEVTRQMAGGHNPRLARFQTDWQSRRFAYRAWYMHNTCLGGPHDSITSCDLGSLVFPYARIEAERRAARIFLALQAWKLDHGGQLPKSLDALKGKYLDQIPLDPCSGEPFRYYPEGRPVGWRPQYHGYQSGIARRLAPGTPFLWSVGERISVQRANSDDPDRFIRYWIHQQDSFGRYPTCEEDLLVCGWAFPLPSPVADRSTETVP